MIPTLSSTMVTGTLRRSDQGCAGGRVGEHQRKRSGCPRPVLLQNRHRESLAGWPVGEGQDAVGGQIVESGQRGAGQRAEVDLNRARVAVSAEDGDGECSTGTSPVVSSHRTHK